MPDKPAFVKGQYLTRKRLHILQSFAICKLDKFIRGDV